MKLTRDLCWLLGLGGDGRGQEDMEGPGGAAGLAEQTDHRGSSQAEPNGEEGLDEDEKTRRRAERRKAKRKRQKERKKLEREERTEEDEEEDASELCEEPPASLSESDSEEEVKVEEEWTAVRPRSKCGAESVSALAAAVNKRHLQVLHRTAEEELEWDVSSAFVANAANHMKLKGVKSRALQSCRENMENEETGCQMASSVELKRRGESLTAQGIEMFERGCYGQAVHMFTEAICCDPRDHRVYGNRSYCYWCLDQFSPALSDAQRSIQLAPDWPKGYFRKGCALMGLKRYAEAEKAMGEVLRLDQRCKEASSKRHTCRVLQLMELGFAEEQSKLLLQRFTTVHTVLSYVGVKALREAAQQDQSGNCRSLWVGNVTSGISEKDLLDLFKTFGEVESVRILYERFCAFVNFKNANTAAAALEKLQGVELRCNKLVIRYPDSWFQRTTAGPCAAAMLPTSAVVGSRPKFSLLGNECFYWRTTGCIYGNRCRFRHIPEQQGRDKKQ